MRAVDIADPDVGQPRAARRSPPRWTAIAGALVLYGGGCALVYRHLLARLGSSLLSLADPVLFVWWLRWIPFAILHGHNALEPKWTNFPFGVNAMWNLSVPLLGILAAPLTLTVGPVAAGNLFSAFGPAVSAFVAFLVVRRYVRSPVASIVGGLAYGFAPFFTAHGSGHLPLVWGVFPPLLLLFLDEILVRQRYSPALMGALLGAACLAQVLIEPEVLALGSIVAVVAGVVLAVSARGDVVRRLPYAAAATLVAGAVVVVVGAWPLWVFAFGPNRPRGLVQTPSRYVADLLSFVVPPRYLAFRPFATVNRAFSAPPVESTAYVGLPLLVLVAAFAVWRRRTKLVRAVAITTAIIAVLSLGSTLEIYGVGIGGAFLPWRAVEAIPVLKDALPVRLSQYAAFGAAVIVALALDAFVALPSPRRWLGCAAVVVALAPLLPRVYDVAPVPPTPPILSGPAIPYGSVAVLEPYPSYPMYLEPMLWQAQVGMRFATPYGLAFTSATHKSRDGIVYASFDSEPTRLWKASRQTAAGHPPRLTEQLRSGLLRDLRVLRARAVIVMPGDHEADEVNFFESLLGMHPQWTGGAWLFRLPQP